MLRGRHHGNHTSLSTNKEAAFNIMQSLDGLICDDVPLRNYSLMLEGCYMPISVSDGHSSICLVTDAIPHHNI